MTLRTSQRLSVLLLVLSALLALLSVAGRAFGQTESSKRTAFDHVKLTRQFDSSLESNITGIVESTIYDMIEYKSRCPNLDYSRMVNALNSLTRDSRDSSISYKAHLATMYLSYGNTLDDRSAFDPENHEQAFKLVAEQLERKFLFSQATQ